jgi:epoxyqueuosine reductase
MTAGERSTAIKSLAVELGFQRCGIARAAPIARRDYVRQWLAQGRAGTMGYLHRHIESRIDVLDWLPSARSVIVVALNYHQPAQSPPDDRPRGRVAMYAWGQDYHVVVREKLDQLLCRVRERLAEPFMAKICVDTSAIIERELAASAGIGWIGKNTLVLHQHLGSYFFLGAVITDLELAPDAPEPDHCGTCMRCLEACPTQAFPTPYTMDARRCISYLTIENRGDIDPVLAEKMGNWVFGCDVCQEVCPYNQDAPHAVETAFRGAPDAAFPKLSDILSWNQKAYAQAVRGKATGRANLAMWHRNVEMVMKNRDSVPKSASDQAG